MALLKINEALYLTKTACDSFVSYQIANLENGL